MFPLLLSTASLILCAVYAHLFRRGSLKWIAFVWLTFAACLPLVATDFPLLAVFVFVGLTCSVSDVLWREASRHVLRVSILGSLITLSVMEPSLAPVLWIVSVILLALFFLPGFGPSDVRALIFLAPYVIAFRPSPLALILFMIASVGGTIGFFMFSPKVKRSSIPFIPILFFGVIVGAIGEYALL